MTTLNDLARAAADLTTVERAAIFTGATDARDRRSANGDHRVAAFFAVLAAFVAEVDDEQRRTLHDLERDLDAW